MNLLQYLQLFVQYNLRRTATSLALFNDNKISHDTLLRVLYADWSGKKHLESITRPRKFRGGYLVIDDTGLEKPHSKKMEGSYYFYSSSKRRCVLGYQLVLLVWVKGKKRVVLDAEIYQPESGQSKIDIALAMISYARNTLKIKPDFVLFDSWYSAKAIMKRLTDYGWGFVSRIKRNRLFNGKKLSLYRLNPYWNEAGLLAGGLKVRIVKNGKKFFVTNRLSLTRNQILEIYRSRQSIEEVNKQLKYIGLNDCQCLSFKAQKQYVWICILAFSLLERESRKRGLSLYHLKKINIYKEDESLIDWGAVSLKAA